MSLPPGTRLGVYEVTSPLGEGGVGQVWRARDTKLNRDVALKVLPDLFADDPDRLARFTRVAERWARFSPDGRFVAYMSNESGRGEIYVRPFIEGGGGAGSGQWQVSTAGGISPVWRADGAELYYVAPEGTLMAAPIRVRGAELLPGAPVPLFRPRISRGGADVGIGPQYDVSRDGRFLINTVADDATLAPITLIQNWNPERKK